MTAWEGRHEMGSSKSLTLRDRLAWLADGSADQPFLISRDPSGASQFLTYGQVGDLAQRTAGLFESLGVSKGDTIHVQLGNCPQFLACLFGAAQLGAVIVPTNASASIDDVTYVTSHAGCRVSVVGLDHASVAVSAQEMVPEIGHVVSVGGTFDSTVDYDAAVGAATSPRRRVGVDGTDVAAIVYTSGTTGWPKGVMVTNSNLLFAGDAVGSLLRVRPDDRWLVTLPLSHMNALSYSTMSALCAGGSIALVERFDPAGWVRAARDLGASLASLFAVHARQVLACEAQPGDDANPLRLVLFAVHMSGEERERFERRFGAELIQVYGLTETLAPTLCDPAYGPRQPDTVGRPTLWSEVRLVDETGADVPVGGDGELLVRGEPGHTLMAGYFRRPDDTAATMTDGWFRTGDRLRRERDDFFTFLGRSSEVIKPGADNVSAVEVERVLVEHPAVADASVVGARDETGDECIVAYIVVRDEDDATPHEILSWAQDRLADYKVPRRVIQVRDLPRGPVGKVAKATLASLSPVATSDDVVTR